MDRERLIREFQRDRFHLIGYIRSLVGDPDLTEDLFQEVTVVVLQKSAEFEEGKDLQAWCRGIARNLVLREREKSARLRVFEGDRILDLVDAAYSERTTEDSVEAQRSLLRRCMELLGSGPRELLTLRYGSELSLRQISTKLERTEGAVQVALSRIRKWLGDCVSRRGEAGPEVAL